MRDINDLKSTLASAIRLLTAEGLIDFNGHMSVRPAPSPRRRRAGSARASGSAASC